MGTLLSQMQVFPVKSMDLLNCTLLKESERFKAFFHCS